MCIIGPNQQQQIGQTIIGPNQMCIIGQNMVNHLMWRKFAGREMAKYQHYSVEYSASTCSHTIMLINLATLGESSEPPSLQKIELCGYTLLMLQSAHCTLIKEHPISTCTCRCVVEMVEPQKLTRHLELSIYNVGMTSARIVGPN